MEGVREREEKRLEKKRSDMERYREEGDGEKERRERGRGGTERKIYQIKAAACSFPPLPRPYPFTVSLCVLQVTFLRE